MSNFFATNFGRGSILAIGGGIGIYQLYTKLLQRKSQNLDINMINEKDRTRMHLKNVHIFFRHGARTPLLHVNGLSEVVYDKNILLSRVEHMEIPLKIEHISGGPRPISEADQKYEQTKFQGGVSAGMLTHIGKNQCYLLGSRLSKKYPTLVGSKFNPSNIVLRSTNINRCIDSMKCVLAGMYGFTSGMSEPIVKVESLDNEILIPNSSQCLNLKALIDHSIVMLSKEKSFVQLYKKVNNILGMNSLTNSWEVIELRDNIIARETHNLYVPQKLLEIFPEIDKLAVKAISDSLCCSTDSKFQNLSKELAIGRLLYHISENLQNISLIKLHDVAKNKKYSSLNLYSCHDSSILPLLIVFDCFDNKWPPYAADLCIELYEDSNNQHWVRVSYCDKDLILNGYENSLITLENFLERMKPFMISYDEYTVKCNQADLVPYQIYNKSQNRLPPMDYNDENKS